jgi:predicted amidophosphoribosyltransferase
LRGLWRALHELLVPSVCPACDAPRETGELLLCGFCARGVRSLPRLRGVRTAIAYEATGLVLVRRMKFEHRRDAAAVLGALLATRLRGLAFDAIVPLPRHPARVRAEQCDPVHTLALRLARATGARVREAALRRARLTPPQTGLSQAARRRNVAGSFAARPNALAGQRVLLLDDVATTGATLAEAARTLHRHSGARRIYRAAVAGTPPLVL